MGVFLVNTHRKDLYTIGFEFNQGSFLTQFFDRPGGNLTVKEATLGPAPIGTLPYTLAQTGIPLYFVDFSKSLQNDVVQRWLKSRQKAHFYGGLMTSKRSFEEIRPAESYDALVFVEKTSRAVPLSK